ncbi:hypothetical protein C8R44DRAFT_783104 [Mycena epipterygia]|nr:hypothetical protein C8R44DRAFT_783104 [Mycena epipterygia]
MKSKMGTQQISALLTILTARESVESHFIKGYRAGIMLNQTHWIHSFVSTPLDNIVCASYMKLTCRRVVTVGPPLNYTMR